MLCFAAVVLYDIFNIITLVNNIYPAVECLILNSRNISWSSELNTDSFFSVYKLSTVG